MTEFRKILAFPYLDYTLYIQWHQIEERVKLNTPGQRNGEFMLFNNGELVIHLTDVNYRATDSIKIMGVHFNTFYGGSDSTWYPDEMNSIDFRVSYFFIKELYFSCPILKPRT